jgi:uncharacterized protein (TIGR03083 family)
MDPTEASRPVLVAAVRDRGVQIVEALSSLDAEALGSASRLPRWSRLTIACHLRFGAQTLGRMTKATLLGEPAAYYPEGRSQQRSRTLDPYDGEGPLDVVASLRHHSDELHRLWSSLGVDAWSRQIIEPENNPDLGSISLAFLPLLRLTELEIHGSDLGVGLPDWSQSFVRAALPARLSSLNVRRSNHRAVDTGLQGAWLLVATDGPTFRIDVKGADVESVPADSGEPARAVIEATSRDLLALLLGRPFVTPPRITGDIAFGEAFSSAFPGP